MEPFIAGSLTGHIFTKTGEIHYTLSKFEYNELVKKKRQEYVHTYFYPELYKFYLDLEIDAKAIKPCHRNITFKVPLSFDIDKTEVVLCEYFKDLGYKTLTEIKKDNILTLTIT